MGIWTLHSDTDSPAEDNIQRKLIIFIPFVLIFSVAQQSWVLVESFLIMFFCIAVSLFAWTIEGLWYLLPLKMTSVHWWQNFIELNRQQIFSGCSVKILEKPQNTSSLQKNPANAGLWRARVGPSALTTSQHLLTHQVYLFNLGILETERATQSPEWMLAMYVSANHGFIWVFYFFMLQLTISFGSILCFDEAVLIILLCLGAKSLDEGSEKDCVLA